MKKRFLAILCVIAMMVLVLPSAYAEENKFIENGPLGGASINVNYMDLGDAYVQNSISLYSTTAATEEEAYNSIVDAVRNRELLGFIYETEDESGNKIEEIHYGIDISSLNLTLEDEELINEICEKILYFHPELLTYNYWNYWYSGGKILFLEIFYIFDEEECETEKAKLQNAIDEYVSLAENVPDTVGKLLVVHDAFAKNCRYATEELAYIESNENYDIKENVIYTGYGALVNKVAVCQGNAIALNQIFKALGFETALCCNDNPEVNHIWNMVKIDGNWYHIDETRNDSDVFDTDGSLMQGNYYNWFLVTDEFLVNTGHGQKTDWEIDGDETNISCTDDKYGSGYIFSGDYKYGSWYGNITYENSKYKMNIMGVVETSKTTGKAKLYQKNFPYFYSSYINTDALVASEPFETVSASTGQTMNAVTYFSNSNLGSTDAIIAQYEGKVYKRKTGGTYFTSLGAQTTISLAVPNEKLKIMLWKTGTQEPVSEAILVD